MIDHGDKFKKNLWSSLHGKWIDHHHYHHLRHPHHPHHHHQDQASGGQCISAHRGSARQAAINQDRESSCTREKLNRDFFKRRPNHWNQHYYISYKMWKCWIATLSVQTNLTEIKIMKTNEKKFTKHLEVQNKISSIKFKLDPVGWAVRYEMMKVCSGSV